MFVCICNGVTDKQIRQAVATGANDLETLQSRLSVANNCGECACMAQQLIDEEAASLAGQLAYSAA